jgi:O-antigen/teichoic acid export membrane protein
MLKDIKDTSKHSFIYALGNVASKIIGIILIPIYTNSEYLTVADFGSLAILEASAQLMTGLFAMAMLNSLQRWYWDQDYVDKQKSIFFTSLLFLLLINLPVFSILVLSAKELSLLIFSSVDYTYILKLTILTVGARIIANQCILILKLRSKSAYYSFIQIAKLLITLLLTIWLVTQKGKGLEGIWEASLLGEILSLVLVLPYVLKNIKPKFQSQILGEMLKYGYPLMLSSVAISLLTVMDRYMLKFMSGLETTAVYAIGLRFANTLNLVITLSLNAALSPIRMKKMNDSDNKRFYSKILLYISFVFIIFLLGLSLFSIEILKVLAKDEDYWIATNIIPILSFAFLFTVMRQNVVIGLMIKKKTKIIASMIFITTVINFLLNYFLIPILDFYGASLATLLSQLILFIVICKASQKVYPIPYEWRKIALLIGLAIIYILIGLSVINLNIWLRLPIKIFLFACFPFVLSTMQFFEKIELSSLKKIFNAWKTPGKLKENIFRFFRQE